MYLIRNTFEWAMGKVNRLSKNERGLLLKYLTSRYWKKPASIQKSIFIVHIPLGCLRRNNHLATLQVENAIQMHPNKPNSLQNQKKKKKKKRESVFLQNFNHPLFLKSKDNRIPQEEMLTREKGFPYFSYRVSIFLVFHLFFTCYFQFSV